MAKVNNKTKGFNSISRDVVFDVELSDRARFLYIYMACKPEGWEFFQDKVAEELGYKKDTLRKYLDELITSGRIEEKEQQNDGKFGSLEYVIRLQRKNGENLPIRKKPDTEKTRIGKNHNHKDLDNISSDNISSDIKEKDKEKNNNKKRFSKPTIEQVDAYIKEKKMHFEAEQFFDHYEANGWMVGRTPMKDWQAACRYWERMRKKENPDEEPAVEIPADDVEVWNKTCEWMRSHTPFIVDKVDYKSFAKMRAMAMFKGDVFFDILREIDQLTYDCDVVKEFERLSDSEKYSRRITA